MKNAYYNGLIEYDFSVSIKSSNHETCLTISKKLKEYFSAWSFSCSYPKEYKSARKGDVLTREIMVHFEDYPSTVIAFKEGLRCICYHYDLFTDKTTVKIIDRSTLPKDSEKNIFS